MQSIHSTRASRDAFGKPITVTVKQACRLLGLGNTSVWKLISTGRLRTIRIGKRRLVVFQSIEELVAAS
jgi:excisionase family DNA binding protein